MNKLLKWILILLGVALMAFFVGGYLLYSAFDFCDGKTYTKEDLIDNYQLRSTQIKQIKEYMNSIVPPGKSVDIEFDGSKNLSIFHLIESDKQDRNWDLSASSPKTDTLLEKLGWTRQTLKTLKEKLDAANCIYVSSGEPCNIGFQRSCLGMYSYNLFDKPIADSLMPYYNDSCRYILYTDQVVLEYGGGAVGPQCFERE
jgi:nitrogen fixation-related uncharacterized protein